MNYPDNSDGDALRRLEASGDDLSRPRNIEFTVVFPEGDGAERFAGEFRALGYVASVEFSETAEGCPWDVVIIKQMIPSYDEIQDFERALQIVANRFGGRNDGWGCFSQGLARP